MNYNNLEMKVSEDKTEIATAIKDTTKDLKKLVYLVNKYEIDSEVLYRRAKKELSYQEHKSWKTFKHTQQYYINQKYRYEKDNKL